MESILKWLDGKKMYLTALAVAVIAGLQSLGIVIPEYVYTLLAAFGVYSAKSAIKKVE